MFMKRHLTEADVQALSDDDYRLLLSEQLETHRRLREQAQSIIRMVLSGVGIIVALLGYKLYPEFQLPSRTLTAAGGNLQFDGLLQGMAENSLHVAILFVTLAIGLLFFSVVKSIAVLSSDGPVPVSRHKSLDRELNTEITDGTDGKLAEWILANDARLVEAPRQVEQSFSHIWASFFAGAIAIALGTAALLGWLPVMGAIHLLLVVGGPIVLIYYLKDSFITLVTTIRGAGIRSAFSDTLDVYHDTIYHHGLDGTMKVSLIIFYGVYYDYSLNAAYVWLTLFVL